MHVRSNKDPVEIKGRGSVLSVARILPCEYLLHRRNSFLEDCTVTTEVRAVCEVRITQVEIGGHRRNYARK